MWKGNAISIPKFHSERERTQKHLAVPSKNALLSNEQRFFPPIQPELCCLATTIEQVKLLHNFLPNIRAIYLVNDYGNIISLVFSF